MGRTLDTALMPQQDASADDATRRLAPRSRFFVWVALLVLGCVVVGVFGAAAPLRYAQLVRACAGPECALTAGYLVGLDASTALVWLALAGLIFWRRPGDRMGVFCALTFLTFGVARFPDTPLALGLAHPEWRLLVEALRFLGSACLSVFVFVFPDGHFVPRITRWIAAGWILVQVPEFFAATSGASADRWPSWLRALGFLGFVCVVIVAQTWRYQRAATIRQRQQTRWAVLGLALALICYLILTFLYPLVLSLNLAPIKAPPVALTSVVSLSFLLIPVTLAIAMLRFRLYDVDTVINRTLVYGMLSVALVGLYLVCIVGLQSVIFTVTGQRQVSSVAIAATTLLTAAVVQPLRRRLQSQVDRRFYRRKYDAGAAVTTFAGNLRQNLDLGELRGRLMDVIHETMQPSHASLWLRPPSPREPNPKA